MRALAARFPGGRRSLAGRTGARHRHAYARRPRPLARCAWPGTAAADVYSLGKVLYQVAFGMEVGRFPELPTAILRNTDRASYFGLNHIVMKACERYREQRYPTATALHDALRAFENRLRNPPRS